MVIIMLVQWGSCFRHASGARIEQQLHAEATGHLSELAFPDSCLMLPLPPELVIKSPVGAKLVILVEKTLSRISQVLMPSNVL